jgi:hypothetical protein
MEIRGTLRNVAAGFGLTARDGGTFEAVPIAGIAPAHGRCSNLVSALSISMIHAECKSLKNKVFYGDRERRLRDMPHKCVKCLSREGEAEIPNVVRHSSLTA